MEVLLKLDDNTLIETLSWIDNRTLRTMVTSNTNLARFIHTHRMELCRKKLAHLGIDFRKFSSDPCFVYKYRNYEPLTILRKSLRERNIPLLNLALELGVDPSYDNNYAIQWASQDGQLDIVTSKGGESLITRSTSRPFC